MENTASDYLSFVRGVAAATSDGTCARQVLAGIDPDAYAEGYAVGVHRGPYPESYRELSVPAPTPQGPRPVRPPHAPVVRRPEPFDHGAGHAPPRQAADNGSFAGMLELPLESVWPEEQDWPEEPPPSPRPVEQGWPTEADVTATNGRVNGQVNGHGRHEDAANGHDGAAGNGARRGLDGVRRTSLAAEVEELPARSGRLDLG